MLAEGNFTNLTLLHLNDNKISDEGAKALANGKLTNLTLLFLQHYIGDITTLQQQHW